MREGGFFSSGLRSGPGSVFFEHEFGATHRVQLLEAPSDESRGQGQALGQDVGQEPHRTLVVEIQLVVDAGVDRGEQRRS